MECFKYIFTRFPSKAPFNPFVNVGYISSVIVLEKGLAELLVEQIKVGEEIMREFELINQIGGVEFLNI